MVNELWNDFRVYVKPRLGPRKYFELVVFGLLEIGSLYVTSEHITTARPLVVTFWIPVGLVYIWLAHFRGIKTGWQRICLILVILSSVAWAFELSYYLNAIPKEIERTVKLGIELAEGGNSDAALNAFTEARLLARYSNDKDRELLSVCALGEYQGSFGNPDAGKTLEECLSLASELGKVRQEAMAYVYLGQLEAMTEDGIDRARQDYQDALKLLVSPADSDVKAIVISTQGDLERNLGNDEEAIRDYRAAGDLYGEKGDRQMEAHNLIGLGDLENVVGHDADALADYEKAADIYSKIPQREDEAHALSSVADVEVDLGKYDNARRNYGAALGLYDDPRGEGNVYIGLGRIEYTQGDTVKARGDYKKAFDSYGINVTGKCIALLYMGTLETDLGNYTEASTNLMNAQAFCSQADDPLDEANFSEANAELATEMGKFDLARQDFDDALKFYGPHGDREDQARAQLGLGKLESRLGHIKEASRDYDEANRIFANNPPGEADALYLQGELEREQRKYPRAAEDYTKAQQTYKSEGNQAGEAKVTLGFGDIDREQRKIKDAERYHSTTRGLFQKQENKIGEANVDLSEGVLLAKLGQREKALDLLKIAEDLYSKMGKKDKVRETSLEISRLGGSARAGH